MKKLATFIFGLLISVSFYADARLVSGTAQHRHDSATGGGDSLSSSTKIAPSIFVYDSAAPANEKYWKFGNSSGDFVLFTYDDAQQPVQTALTISRTGTSVNETNLFGNVVVGNTLSSTKPCDTGFTRAGPNFCKRSAPYNPPLMTRDFCEPSGVSAGASAVVIKAITFARSNNVSAGRYSAIRYYTDNLCSTGLITLSEATGYEFVAVPAATNISSDHETSILISPPSSFWLRHEDDAGNQGLGYYWIVGYFD